MQRLRAASNSSSKRFSSSRLAAISASWQGTRRKAHSETTSWLHLMFAYHAYIYIYTYTYTYIYIHIHIYITLHLHLYLHLHLRFHLHLHLYLHLHLRFHLHLHLRFHLHLHLHLRYITVTLHCITLHYITYVNIYILYCIVL